MLDYSDIIETIIDDNLDDFQKCKDINDLDIDYLLHCEVDNYVSCLHFKVNKQIIEDDFDKDIFEVLSDYNDNYGDVDLKKGKVHIYAILAFYCIMNYTTIHDELEAKIKDIINQNDESDDDTEDENVCE